MNLFYVFLYYIFPPLILVLGMLGNIIGLSLMKRPGMSYIGPKNIYKYLFAFDIVNLAQIVVNYLQYSFRVDLTILSKFACRIWMYINYSLATPSVMFLLYLSIDRYISIRIPARRFLLRKRNYQLIYCIFILMINLIYYLPLVYTVGIFTVNNTTVCNYNSVYDQNLISFMDLVNRVCLPTLLIMIFSVLLSIQVIKSKQRILSNFKHEENKFYFKQIRLAVSSIFLNITYVSCQLPISIFSFYTDYYLMDEYMLTYYLYYLSYAINFYVLLFSSSVFKNEFVSFVKTIFSKKTFQN